MENKNSLVQRVDWLDVFKCIAMFLVLRGHVDFDNSPESIRYYIYAFHMPLFFMIAGMGLYLQLNKREYSILEMTKNKARTLLWPYFIFNIIMIPMWIFNFRILTQKDESYTELISAIFYSNQEWNSMPTSTTWFITTLFLAIMLFVVIRKYCNNHEQLITLACVLMGLIGYVMSLNTTDDFIYPWHMDTVPIGCMLVMMGYMFIKHLDFFDRLIGTKWWQRAAWIVVMIAIGYCCARANVKISMHVNVYGSMILFIGAVIAFSLACYIISRMLPTLGVFKLIGRNTIVYLAIHEQIFRSMQYYSDFTRHLVYDYSTLTSLAVFILLIPVAYVVEKWLPFLIGKKKRKFA